MRKLASIQKIKDLTSIEGADRIEVATINGWKVVVQRGLYEVGDLCVYFEIDAVLPLEHFPDLERGKGRIKTMRLRGQLSQGYCIPMDRFWEIVEETAPGFNQDVGFGIHVLEDGVDVTGFLGVEKYEPPITFNSGEAKGNFPCHILPKTDEDRIQSNPEYLEKFKGKMYTATVKYDGSSASFGFDNGEFFAASRNLILKDGDNVYWNIARKYNFGGVPNQYVIQGEVCGPGIQKNRLGLKEIDFFVFRIYNQETKKFLGFEDRISFCIGSGLKHVDLAYTGILFDFNIAELIEKAEGKYLISGQHREGIVFEADDNIETEFGGHLSFKVINNKFLISGGD